MADRAPPTLRPRGPSATSGQSDDDLIAFWPAFMATAAHVAAGGEPLRPAVSPGDRLRLVFAEAAAVPVRPDAIRAFLDARFQLQEVEASGFLTGYYEPVVEASPVRTDAFRTPVLPRPPDLVTVGPDLQAGLPDDVSAGRRRRDGTLEAYPDRAAIEAGALDGLVAPIAWLRDPVELFLIQVQGSARLRMPDGDERRLVYAGRNGQPYTSIGRHLIEAGEIAADAMSLEVLKGWLRANGQDPGGAARDVMQRNRSYVFFRLAPSGAGPIGGAGVPLTPGRSVAVDRAVWPYGLPVLVETDAPLPGFPPAPLRRLFVAQDTGSAIVGSARVDLFVGSGDAAGRDAGCIRHPGRVTALLPRP